jgi:acyl-CoA reductase-like NAD-dependent aldehyde dehydrogenase
MVSFTGSVGVGKRIRSLAGLKRVTLELGSNSPNIVTPSADLEAASTAILRGGFSHAGQSCVSVQRLYLHSAIESSFLGHFAGRRRRRSVTVAGRDGCWVDDRRESSSADRDVDQRALQDGAKARWVFVRNASRRPC